MLIIPKYFLLAAALVTFCACTSVGHAVIPYAGKNAKDFEYNKKHYKVGKPYKILGKRYYPSDNLDYSEEGEASWYGTHFHRRKTANGEIFNKYALTAAHRTLPLPTIVTVTNLENGSTIDVRVNDRGPFAHNRIIDLSRGAARKIGMEQQGTAKVRVDVNHAATAALFAHKSSHEAPIISNYPQKDYSSGNESEGNIVSNIQKSTNLRQYRQEHAGYSLQIGAFKNSDNAQAKAKEISSIMPAKVTEDYSNGAPIYRVLAGPFTNEAEVARARQTFEDYGITQTVMVRR